MTCPSRMTMRVGTACTVKRSASFGAASRQPSEASRLASSVIFSVILRTPRNRRIQAGPDQAAEDAPLLALAHHQLSVLGVEQSRRVARDTSNLATVSGPDAD
jgi:hypothetical protein